MAGVSAQLALSIKAALTGAGDLGDPKHKLSDIREVLEFTPGTDAVTKADILFADTRQLAASADEDLDLAGVLSNAFGATIAAAEVVALFVKAADDNTNNVVVSVPGAAGFTGPFLAAADGYTIKPGEFLFFASATGWAVTATSADLLNVANSAGGTTVDYDIVIIARTVAA